MSVRPIGIGAWVVDRHRVALPSPDIDDLIGRYLDAIRSGDRTGFTGLFQVLSGKVAGYVKGRGVADVEDVVNEVFLGAFRNFDSFDGDAAKFRSWIFAIALNKVADWHRARCRQPVVADQSDEILRTVKGGDSECEAVDTLQSQHVIALLDELTEDQRNVLLLRVIADLSLEATASALGKPVGAVKSIQHRVLATLRRTISDRAVSNQHVSAITGVR